MVFREFVEIVEGKTRALVPDEKLYRRPDGVYEPAWAPVFYNPKMVFNRDIAVLVAITLSEMFGKKLVVVEPLGGTGIRALRYAVEAEAKVYVSDIDPKAVEIIKKNIELNNAGNRVIAKRSDANTYMHYLYEKGIVPDMIDIDPFGSPQPFIDTAIRLLRGRGILAATATDVAVLGATYPRKLLRRYGIRGYKTYWGKEQAVRNLVAYITLRAAAHDASATPLLAYYADYYVRVYIKLERGADKAYESLKSLGYAYTCNYCNYASYSASPEEVKPCPYCGGIRKPIGPTYTGPLCNLEFVEKLLEKIEETKWLQTLERIRKLLSTLKKECNITKPYARLDKICSYLRVHMPPMKTLIDTLSQKGYIIVATHFDKRGIKTSTPYPLLLKTIQELSHKLYSRNH